MTKSNRNSNSNRKSSKEPNFKYKLTIKHLLERGLVKPGQVFHYKLDRSITAQVDEDGQLVWELNNKTHRSMKPSTFSSMVHKRKVSGWDYILDEEDNPLKKYKSKYTKLLNAGATTPTTTTGTGIPPSQQQNSSSHSITHHPHPSSQLQPSFSSHSFTDHLLGMVLVRKREVTEDTEQPPDPIQYDLAFHLYDSCIYCSRSLVCSRSNYFRRLVCQQLNKYEGELMPKRLNIHLNELDSGCSSIGATTTHVLRMVLQHMVSNRLTELVISDDAVPLYVYCQRIGYDLLKSWIVSTLSQALTDAGTSEETVLSITEKFEQIDEEATEELIRSIQSSVYDHLFTSDYSILGRAESLNLSESAIAHLLTLEHSVVDEEHLFMFVVLWGMFQMFQQGMLRTESLSTHHSIYQHSNFSYTLHFLQRQDSVPLGIELLKDSTMIGWTSISELRNRIDRLLPHIRFETMTNTHLFDTVEKTQLFTSVELLEFVRAQYLVEEGQTYTIFGNRLEQPRKKRHLSIYNRK